MAAYNIGSFRERPTVLRLEVSNLDTSWQPVRKTWAMAEREKSGNIFSSVGLSAESWTFTVRKQDITMADALLFNGQHHFITAITEPERGFFEIRTARVQVAQCESIAREGGGVKFPAALTEKYVKFEQQMPMATNTVCYVLVTPKSVVLKPGSRVAVNGVPYPILTAHTLDCWKNEYEIQRECDL